MKPLFWSELDEALLNIARERKAAASNGTNGVNGHAPVMPGEDIPPTDHPAASPIEQLPLAELLTLTARRIADAVAQLNAGHEMLLNDVARLESDNKDLRSQLARALNLPLVAAPKPLRPKVAVIGALRQQFDEIAQGAREYGLDLDLRHIDKDDEQPRNIRCDYIISLRFISHGRQDNIKHCVGSGHYCFLKTGGVTGAINQLRAWFAK